MSVSAGLGDVPHVVRGPRVRLEPDVPECGGDRGGGAAERARGRSMPIVTFDVRLGQAARSLGSAVVGA